MFDERTKKVACTKQAQAVKGKSKSDCPLCAAGHDANKARIYKLDEMDDRPRRRMEQGGRQLGEELRNAVQHAQPGGGGQVGGRK